LVYKSRLVPLGKDVVQLLRKYLITPGRWNQHYQPLFQSRLRRAIGHKGVETSFRRLCNLGGYNGVVAGNEITRAGCWAHLTRRIIEAEK
jgi:site-specific recombinase XerC